MTTRLFLFIQDILYVDMMYVLHKNIFVSIKKYFTLKLSCTPKLSESKSESQEICCGKKNIYIYVTPKREIDLD